MALEKSKIYSGKEAARAGSVVWLLLLVWPLWNFLASRPGHLELLWAFCGTAVFASCWLRVMWRALSVQGGTPVPWALAGFYAAALSLFPVFGYRWSYCAFIFAVSASATLSRRWGYVIGVSLIVAVESAVFLMYGVSPGEFWWVPLVTVLEAVVVHSFKRVAFTLHELDLARAEMARLAVENERLRFARDLHDILGHTLTSIVIRSQLSARLVHRDADRAAGEMADVERAARQALDDVRDAVSGYRALSLSGELDNARRVLTVAGIRLEVLPPARPVPASAESMLAWAVREGTTNVLRHSRASRCSIRLSADAAEVRVEVCDDGRRRTDGRSGHGLAGLAERVAVLGGSLDAGPLPEGGYRMCARVPTEAM